MACRKGHQERVACRRCCGAQGPGGRRRGAAARRCLLKEGPQRPATALRDLAPTPMRFNAHAKAPAKRHGPASARGLRATTCRVAHSTRKSAIVQWRMIVCVGRTRESPRCPARTLCRHAARTRLRFRKLFRSSSSMCFHLSLFFILQLQHACNDTSVLQSRAPHFQMDSSSHSVSILLTGSGPGSGPVANFHRTGRRSLQQPEGRQALGVVGSAIQLLQHKNIVAAAPRAHCPSLSGTRTTSGVHFVAAHFSAVPDGC